MGFFLFPKWLNSLLFELFAFLMEVLEGIFETSEIPPLPPPPLDSFFVGFIF